MQQNIRSNFDMLRLYEPQLWRLGALAQAFPDAEIVSTLSTKLSAAMSPISCPCSG